MQRNGNIFTSIDLVTIAMYLAMVFFGWINVYGAIYNYEMTSMFSFSNMAGKQFVWIMTSFVVALVILVVDHKLFDMSAYLIYFAWIVVLIATAKFATPVKGSLSWLKLGPISLQPAEFSKFITALALAKWMGQYEFKIKDWRDLAVPLAIILAPMFIIMVLEKETGSALVYAAFFLVLYREGMSGYVLWTGLAVFVLFVIVIKYGNITLPLGTGNVGVLVSSLVIIAIAAVLLIRLAQLKRETLIMLGAVAFIYAVALIVNIWHKVNFNIVAIVAAVTSGIYAAIMNSQHRNKGLWLVAVFVVGAVIFCQLSATMFAKLPPHQRKRIEVTLKIKDDPTGVEYNVIQAKIAIGSGGLTGKGYKQGTQTKLRFVPEQHTDFIFSTIGEEFGFLGTLAVVVTYMFFILRLIFLAERQKDMFSQIFGYSVACIFLMHFTINIGMVLGILPVIGIPLPFFSYGGSSTLGFTILLFIFLKLDAARVEKL